MLISINSDNGFILNSTSEDFRFGIDDPGLFEKLKEELKLHPNGLAIAAIQIGVPKRVFAFYDGRIIINPVIKTKSIKYSKKEEGCLSVPDVFIKMERPTFVILEYFNEVGELQKSKFENLEARVVCHEIDHMNGILIHERKARLDKQKEEISRGSVSNRSSS